MVPGVVMTFCAGGFSRGEGGEDIYDPVGGAESEGERQREGRQYSVVSFINGVIIE